MHKNTALLTPLAEETKDKARRAEQRLADIRKDFSSAPAGTPATALNVLVWHLLKQVPVIGALTPTAAGSVAEITIRAAKGGRKVIGEVLFSPLGLKVGTRVVLGGLQVLASGVAHPTHPWHYRVRGLHLVETPDLPELARGPRQLKPRR